MIADVIERLLFMEHDLPGHRATGYQTTAHQKEENSD
jgi:hypothetical protein